VVKLNFIVQLYQDNPVIATAVSYLFVSSAVGAMPSPTYTTGMFYRWLFDFLHTFTGGLFRVIATRNAGFQSTSGAQPYRPENAPSNSTAVQIKSDLQHTDDIKNDVVTKNPIVWNKPGEKK
jgi:hypothetical protein